MLRRLWNVFPMYEILLLLYAFAGICMIIYLSASAHELSRDYRVISDIVTFYEEGI